MSRKVCYVSGTRADFGLMQSTLQAIHAHPDLELSMVVTGMHLLPQYGNTVIDIERAQLPISQRIPIDMDPATGATMARNVGRMLSAFVDAFEQNCPDVVLLLGDRGEMLAAAIAAIHMNIPIAHIHGGELSGTVDEPVRHAISKLSHYHFASTAGAAERLVRMGEHANKVCVTGAPGLDGLASLARVDRASLLGSTGFDRDRPVALMVFHPVLQEAASAGKDTALVLDTLTAHGVQIVALMPNSDAGSDAVRAALAVHSARPAVRVLTHLPRELFVSWMASADLMIGNSSAGIIEAASFGTPVINIGTRQGMRERNANVYDATVTAADLSATIDTALSRGRFEPVNVYGDGRAGERIVALLQSLPLGESILMKNNAY